MAVIKWLQSVINSAAQEVNNRATPLHTIAPNKKNEKNGSVDLVNATIVEHAEDLGGLIASGSNWIRRRKLKKMIKKKVGSAIADQYNDPEIIEEVTERIINVAEVDPFYKKIFGNGSE